ncbi:MAG: 30S ribosomal protein S6--L-glutamate ligase [Pseudobdellovibrionaceae bacterium]
MKLALLSRKKSLYSSRRLLEAAEQRGHSIHTMDPLRCYMNISSGNPSIHYRGEKLENFDAVIPRIGASVTFYGTAVVRQFEMMGVYPLNESQSISRSRDKLRCLQILSREGVGMPLTSFGNMIDDTEDMLKMVKGTPVVIKLLEGAQGMGVVLAETKSAAESVIDAFRNLKAHFLVQEFISEARGQDIRCFVIGHEVVGAIMRTAKDGEFRANLHQGGSAVAIDVTEAERAIAIKAASTLGLNVAGVDILRSNRGPLILEVNSSPGLEGIEKATGIDIGGKIMEFIETNAAPGKTATRGRG